MTQMTLALITMAVITVVFTVLHLALRTIPYDTTEPHERWRWPVWSWYPLVLGFGLLLAFAGHLYWLARMPGDGRAPEDVGRPSDIQPVRGEDAVGEDGDHSTPAVPPPATPAKPKPDEDDDETRLQPASPQMLAQAVFPPR